MIRENNDGLVTKLKKDIDDWENQEIEFMGEFPKNGHELTKEIAAFATSNPARIYLGISRDKNPIGLSNINKDDILNRLGGLVRSNVKPPIRVDTTFIDYGGNVILRIDVPKGIEPVYLSSNIAYVRNGPISDQATTDQIKEFHKQYFMRNGLLKKNNIGRLPLRFRLGISDKIYRRITELHTDELTGKLTDEEDIRIYEIFMKNIETYSVSDIKYKINNEQYAIGHLGPEKEVKIDEMKEDSNFIHKDPEERFLSI